MRCKQIHVNGCVIWKYERKCEMKGTPLTDGEMIRGVKQLLAAGVTPDKWRAMFDNDSFVAQVAAQWLPEPKRPGIFYDAVTMLGFGTASTKPVPKPAPGKILVRVGAWSLQELCRNKIVVKSRLIEPQRWYEQYSWSNQKLVPGIYALQMPVPDSNCKTFPQQKKLLLSGEEVAPVCLAATTLFLQLRDTGEDLLETNFARCAEQVNFKHQPQAGVRILNGRVWVDYGCRGYREGPSYCVWLASCRKLSD
jgi:hypothetical protein